MKLILVILNFFLLVVLGVRAVSLNIYSNTFGAEKLAGIALLLGAAVGCFLAKKNDDTHLTDNENAFEKEEFEQYKLYATCIISTIIAFFILAFNMNYLLSFSEKQQEIVEINDIQPKFSSRGGILVGEKIVPSSYHIFIEKKDKQERIRATQIDDYQQFVHKKALLTFRTRLFGFACFYPENMRIVE